MKINYKNTALEFLDNPKNVSIHTPEAYNTPMSKFDQHKLLYGVIETFSQEGFSDFFKKNIQYITAPFYSAYTKACDKLKPVVLSEPIEDSGTFIFKYEHHTQTMFYRIVSKGNGHVNGVDVFIIMFTKHSKSDSFALDLAVSLCSDKENTNYGLMDIVWNGFVNEGRDSSWWIANLMMFKTFLKYAEVEIKVINPLKKGDHIGVKYVNDTKVPIKILDSTYFTTISRTEGFGVRGHFRFQPCGEGLKNRRLQWISAYQKNGYTKVAKILNQ